MVGGTPCDPGPVSRLIDVTLQDRGQIACTSDLSRRHFWLTWWHTSCTVKDTVVPGPAPVRQVYVEPRTVVTHTKGRSMSAQGPGPQPPRDGASPGSSAAGGNQRRLGNPTRLIPRRTPPPAQAEPIEMDPLGFEVESDPVVASRSMTEPYPDAAPQDLGRPRVQMFGFPGCLIVSLIASVVLTILLNILF